MRTKGKAKKVLLGDKEYRDCYIELNGDQAWFRGFSKEEGQVEISAHLSNVAVFWCPLSERYEGKRKEKEK